MPDTLEDLLKPGLMLVIVGCNPADFSVRKGNYYADPRNRFWKLLHDSDLVPVELEPRDYRQLLDFGIGLTDISKRPTKRVADLSKNEKLTGWVDLVKKIERIQPRAVAFNGKSCYEVCIGKKVDWGPQDEKICKAPLFVLPSSSGAYARMKYAGKLTWYRQLSKWVQRLD